METITVTAAGLVKVQAIVGIGIKPVIEVTLAARLNRDGLAHTFLLTIAELLDFLTTLKRAGVASITTLTQQPQVTETVIYPTADPDFEEGMPAVEAATLAAEPLLERLKELTGEGEAVTDSIDPRIRARNRRNGFRRQARLRMEKGRPPETREQIVTEIQLLKEDGHGNHTIARMLNERGSRLPSGAEWNPSMVRYYYSTPLVSEQT